MKVLMFGWEFPPHISGGLGTACYGLTKGLAKQKDLELIFVVPKLHGDEDSSVAELIGAGDVFVRQTRFDYREFWKKNKIEAERYYKEAHKDDIITEKTSEVFREISYIEIKSLIQPYLSPEEFDVFLKEKKLDHTKIKVNKDGRFFYMNEGIVTEIETGFSVETEYNEAEAKYYFSGKYGSNLMQEVANYAKVAAVIAKQNTFDIIHAHDWLTYAAGIAAKHISGKPLVIHVHATEFDRGGEHQINSEVYALEKAGMEHADRIITVSNLTRNIVINKYGIDPRKVFTVYNAVEPQLGEDKIFTKTVDEKIVTFLGRITYQKGPEYFVKAAAKVLAKVDNVRFVMAGSGDLLKKMIKYAAKLKITDKFHFTNFLEGEDVTRMFAISDVYVMPSISEPFGISPLEAMRSNVPVIISKQSGVAEVLQNAIKVDFWDDDAIADAIYGLISYDGMSEMFRKKLKPEVDSLKWENAAVQVKNVYDSIFEKKYNS